MAKTKDDIVLEYEKKIMGSEYAKQFIMKLDTLRMFYLTEKNWIEFKKQEGLK